ncbi:MAG: flagellin, partial [uncultured bacterium]
MAQYINTNISSLNAQNNLNKSQNSLQTALQRLSSGTRINSAKDDAAGLGIANRLNAQIKGLNQASRNANDGVSLAQTAEGALNTMADNLQRMRELAVQSANASNTGLDRAALQAEASQIAQELDRVATTTQFNGTNLLDGSFKSQTFQIGANAGQTLNVNMASARSADLGTGAGSALSSAGTHTAAAAGGTTMASGDIIINGVTVGASSASSDNASSKDGSMSAIAKAAAINAVSDQTGVTAQVNTNTAAGASMTAVATDGVMRINGVTTGTISTTTDGTASR